MWLDQQRKYWEQDDRILKNTVLIKELRYLKARSSDRWTGTDTINFLNELIRLNPDLKIPDDKFWKSVNKEQK
jgi:hypothetical protein